MVLANVHTALATVIALSRTTSLLDLPLQCKARLPEYGSDWLKQSIARASKSLVEDRVFGSYSRFQNTSWCTDVVYTYRAAS